ncbi:MAG: dTDP-glucose 4,6-dehydratase [Oscillospiraceae bacterium]|nr:dTDP-glucose 4,6-dehydratase [Oscillospiraceae bacterium]
MEKILVTGGAGFIGSNFIIYMLKQYENILIVNLDALTYCGNLENLSEVEDDPRYHFVKGSVTDSVLLEQLFIEYEFDKVVNFAAESHVDRAILNPNIFIETNVLGTAALLAAARQSWEKDSVYLPGVKFVQISTDEVYGSLGATGFFLETTPLDPHSPYSASKASADLLVKSYFDTYQMPINITRCSNNYGPYQFPEKLIPLMINNCLNHRSLPVYGDGLQVRDWLYVTDHCKAIDMVLNEGIPGEVYNIGGHNERTNIVIVKTIIEYISKVKDSEVTEQLITHVGDRKGHDRRYGVDPTKIKDALGWFPETSFDDGITRTIDWYLENYDWVKRITSGEYEQYYEHNYTNR